MQKRQDEEDRVLKSTTIDGLTSNNDIVESTMCRLIYLAENDCVYAGSARDLILEWMHTMFFEAKDVDIKEDNPNWCEGISGPFDDKYWKAACKKI